MLLESPDRDVLQEARATTQRAARTFALACRLLPRDVRDDVYRLYLVFRTLDDLVDEGRPEAAARIAGVEAWCRGGAAATAEAQILADLDARHGLPRDALEDFCRGMRDDLDHVPCATEADLDRYCYRVAGTVGVVMAAVLGTVGDPARARQAAAALGMAMQRTNILRDIDEDARNGRCYLAQETRRRLAAAAPGGRREALLRDQIARADRLYEEGLAGVALLRRGSLAIRAAAAMYREILRQIERDGYGARPGRAVVSRRRKLAAVARPRTVNPALRRAARSRA
jgi:phytoene synthase